MAEPVVPPPGLSRNIGPVMPAHARRGEFVPVVGGNLNVTLLGEVVRGKVEEVPTRDIVMVRIEGLVTNTREHGFKRGDLVATRRGVGELETEIWLPIDERETQEKAEREKLARAVASAHADPSPGPAPKKRTRRAKA